MAVTMRREMREIPSYIPGKPNELPFFIEKKAYQGATGRVYPLPYTDQLSNVPVMKAYDMVTLENEYISVECLPELGGKIHGATLKNNGYEFIYRNTCIKPAMVGLAGPWVSGGIEFNWPQHHRPTTFMPAEATLVENADGSMTCWMGEAEPFHRMRGMAGVTVYPGSSLVEVKAVIYNRTDSPLPFMWWNNLAVRVHKDYKAVFPPDVEWASDHDRRAIISFPVMKGKFRTARPYDYGDGVDATWFSNIKLPTSVMIPRGQSDMDFLGGYDFAAEAGTVTVADHHISPGKKMWTWGDGDFGRAWCANLTDNGDRYIELMTGVFTDNQPDFTYILPGETKVFSMVWYPVTEIGAAVNATRDAAMSMSMEDGAVKLGFAATARHERAILRVTVCGEPIREECVSIDPDHPVLREFPLPPGTVETSVRAELAGEDGRTLVAWQPRPKGQKARPKERTIPPKPAQVESLEALYLHGAHLEQYKHHTFVPEDYYMEALRRDPEDLRCNLAMGRSCMEKGLFDDARKYLNRAIARLKMRNDNPADPEPIYQLARLERLQGNFDAAYSLFADAAWQYGWRSACLYEMGCIDCMRGERALAVEHLEQALRTNAQHYAARALLGYLTGDAAVLRSILDEAPQDALARYALWLLGAGDVPAFIAGRPQDVVDVALDLLRAGLTDEAGRVLATCTAPDPMVAYYRARCTGAAPVPANPEYCFPNRLEDIFVLKSHPNDALAQYLLGCLYYDRMNYAAAIECWQRSAELQPENAFVWRNLALALYDHAHQPQRAREALERAHSLAPNNARIVYELLQLYKNLNVPVGDRLSFLEANLDAVRSRDDCFLDYIVLHIQRGEYAKARELLLSKRFNIYEGGEGKLTRDHGWLYALWGREAHLAGQKDEAMKWFETALVYPANYGEGRHYSAQEANIYYYMGLLFEDMGDADRAREAWEKAAGQPEQITEITYFAALAERKLGHLQKADAMLRAMIDAGRQKCDHADEYGYFGVGMSAPLPFELDPAPRNRSEGALLQALGYAGLGERDASRAAVGELAGIDPWNPQLSFLRKLAVLE